MKLGLINTAWFGSGVGIAEGFRKTRQIGFDTADVLMDPLDMHIKERRLVKELSREIDLPIVSVGCVALGLSDFNPSVRRFHLDRLRRHLDLAYDLDARNMLLGVGEYIWQREIIAPQHQWQWAVETVREAGQYAADLGVEIAIELEPFELSIVNTLDKMIRFLDEVGAASVRANLDISHLVLAHTPAADIQKIRGRIAHVHLSDCDGKKHGDLPPGRGVVDFPTYLRALREVGFDGVVSIELEYSPEPERIVAWVTEAYQAADRLMRDLGIRGTPAGETAAGG